jgi:HEAT repeat protein
LGYKLTMGVDKVRSATDLFSAKNHLPSNPFHFMFKDVFDELVEAYQTQPAATRQMLDQIVQRLDGKGLDILNQVITDCENADMRVNAMATVKGMGEGARQWSLHALEADEKEKDTVKNALAILRDVGHADEDIDIIRKFSCDPDPRVREEALHTLMHFKAGDLESIIIEAINHADDRLRWRAMKGLGKLQRLSEESTRKILTLIKSDPPEDDQQASIHAGHVSQLIQTFGSLGNLLPPDQLEDAIIEAARKAYESGKRFKGWLKKQDPKADHKVVLSAAFTTLGKIGSSKSAEFMGKFTKGRSDLAQETRKAIEAVKLRQSSPA